MDIPYRFLLFQGKEMLKEKYSTTLDGEMVLPDGICVSLLKDFLIPK